MARLGRGQPIRAKILRRPAQVVVPPPAYGGAINLVTNPSFEVDTAGWTTYVGAGSITRDNTQGGAVAASGSWGVKATSNGTAQTFGPTIELTGLTGNTLYTFSAYVWSPSGQNFPKLALDQYDNFIFLDVYIGPSATVHDAWERLDYTFLTESGCNKVQLRVATLSTASGQSTWVDAAMLVKTLIPQPYFDGTSPGASWSGTAHASTSILGGGTPIYATLLGSGTLSATGVAGAAYSGSATLGGSGTLSTTQTVAFAPFTTNLVKNPSHEALFSDFFWAEVGADTAGSLGSSPRTGSFSWRSTATGASPTFTVRTGIAGGLGSSSMAPVSAGGVYSGGLYTNYVGSGSPTADVSIVWITAAGSFNGVSSTGSSVGLGGGYNRVSVTNVTAPANSAYAVLNMNVGGVVTGDTLDSDDAMIVSGTTLPAYFDGSSSGATWNGPAHQSTSSLLGGGGAVFSGSGTLGAVGAVGGGTAFTGTATLSGSGSLATTQVPRPVQVAALSGSGSLGTTQVPRPAQAATLSGSGTLSTTQAPAIGVTNLITNPSFETGTAGWTSSSTMIGSGPGFSGSVFSYVVGSGSSENINIDFATVAGQPYTVSAYLKSNSGPLVQISGAGGVTSQLTLNTSWQRITATGIASGSTTTLTISCGTLTGGDEIHLDAVMATRGPGLYTYFDGSTSGARWTGTAHASTSVFGGVPVALSGSGTLATTQVPRPTQTAALSGSGTLTTVQVPRPTQVATLSGSGSLTTAGVPAIPGAATLSGSGSLTTTSVVSAAGIAALSGSGVLAVTTRPAWAQAATLTGSGTLTTAQVPRPVQTAALSGSGTLTSSQVPRPAVAAALSGSGTLAAAGAPGLALTAVLSGSGTLSSTGVPAIAASAALTGSGTLFAVGVPLGGAVGTATLDGSGTLSTTAAPAIAQTAVLSGAGTLTTTGVPAIPVVATLSGSGVLSTTQVPRPAQVAALTGAGTLTTTQLAGPQVIIALTGSGTLTVTEIPRPVTTAALTGNGVLSTTASSIGAGTATLTGSGVLSQTTYPQITGTAVLTGDGVLAYAAQVMAQATAQLTGEGFLSKVEPTNAVISVWDGAAEVPGLVTIWNGTSEDIATVELAP